MKKTRQHAEYKGVRILLDQVDNLGTYAEIEIIASDTEIDDAFQRVDSVARDLQLEHVHIASRPYDEMLHNSMMT